MEAAIESTAAAAPHTQRLRRYQRIRAATAALAAPLTAEDAGAQSMAEASPVKWHLAHSSWFFETFVLQAFVPDYRAFHPAYATLFNSYYEALGPRPARAARGLLTRPTLDEVRAYRAHVDEAIDAALERLPAPALARLELGLQHEQQHQELILTDLLHLFSLNPLEPAYRRQAPGDTQAPPLRWLGHAGGITPIGHRGRGFAFDNEGPSHAVLLQPFALASRPVLNGEYREFVLDGGYREPRLWLAEGWDLVRAQGWQRPLYWSQDLQSGFTLYGRQPLQAQRPVCHLSFFEADAYARWAGARLPTEFEWEALAAPRAQRDLGRGQFAEDGELLPCATPSLLGSLWCWTASPYLPYPGFRAAGGALGEYNGKFMCNQWVLRGGSCASPRAHLRASYRNFFHAGARWQFAGLRLARELRSDG